MSAPANDPEYWEATTTIPGVCTEGDLFMIWPNGSVDRVQHLSGEDARAVKRHRSDMSPVVPADSATSVSIAVRDEIRGFAPAGSWVVVFRDGRDYPVSVVRHYPEDQLDTLRRHLGALDVTQGVRLPEARRILGLEVESREPVTDPIHAGSDTGALARLLSEVGGRLPGTCGAPTARGRPCRRQTGGGPCWQHS